jgi:hypothetical protein
MIRTCFGLARDPFTIDEDAPLMEHQQRHFDILKVHNRQGGLCLIFGEPGTGKTILKNAITRHDPKQWITPVINRSLHTWHNLLRLLCHAMQLDQSETQELRPPGIHTKRHFFGKTQAGNAGTRPTEG